MRFSSSLVLSLCFGAVTFSSCSEPPRSRPEVTVDAGSFDRSALLQAFGTCAVTTYKAFDDKAQKLVTALAGTDKAATRAAYVACVDAWQESELMQFGPLGATTLPGGQGLRDNFYAWPLLGKCQTDRAIALKSYEAADFTKTGLATTRGLGTLEYLLYYEGDANNCGSSEDINVNGTWAAIPKEELAARRLAYAKVLANDLVARTKELVTTWEGSFLQSLATAGKGSAVYPSVDDALNSVNDALFYIYFMSRDRKLGVPLGIEIDLCPEGPCADLVESPLDGRNVKNLRANLVGFRKLFEGCGADFSGLGFDDYLTAVGAGALGTEMKAGVVAAIAAVDAYPYATIEEGLTKDVPAVRKLYDALKAITDALKVDFSGVLTLKVPARVGSDMD